MNESEKTFLKSFYKIFSEKVDPELLILGQSDICFNASEKGHLLQLSADRIWGDLILIIAQKCNLVRFLLALYNAGFHDVALEITHRSRKCVGLSTTVKRNSSNRKAQTLYMEMKTVNHNNPLNPHTICKSNTNYYRTCLRAEKDSHKKQIIADILASALSAEISSYVMKYSNTIDIEALFVELREVNTTNTHVLNISYHSHKALVYAVCGKLTDAEEHILAAMEASIFVESCIELVNFHYIRLFVMFAKFGECPSRKLQETVLEMATHVFRSVEGESDEAFRSFWQIMTLQRCIFCLLGLNFKGQPIPGHIPTDTDVHKAKKYMTEVYERKRYMNARRKISDNIAKARIAELENDICTAKIFYRKAVENTGRHYGEINSVKDHIKTIDQISSQISNTMAKRSYETSDRSLTLVKTTNEDLTFPRPTFTHHQQYGVPKLVHTENANDGEAVREYYEGQSMEIINLHGQNTNLKLIHSTFA